MKKICTLLVPMVLVAFSAGAQTHLFLEEQTVQLEDGRSDAWVMPVINNLDEALGDLDKYCRDRSDVKMKKGGDNLLIAEKVSIPAISTMRGDLIGYGFITPNYYAIALVFQMGYDISLNSRAWEEEMANFRTYARQFMSYHYEQAYARRIDAIDNEMKDVEKEKGQNEKQIENLSKKIENNNKKIEKETDELKIGDYRTEITTLESDIENLSNTLPGLTSRLGELQKTRDNLNTEAHTYLGTIGSL